MADELCGNLFVLITLIAAHTLLYRTPRNRININKRTLNRYIRERHAREEYTSERYILEKRILNRAIIGKDNLLPFHLPNDLRRFKKITMGKPIIMGRKTYESIGKSLPGRENIIISRSMRTPPDGFRVFNELDKGLRYAYEWSAQHPAESDAPAEIMIIGGAEIYAQTINDAQCMHITEVNIEVEGADTFFPGYNISEWDMVEKEEYFDGGIPCVYKKLERNGLHALDGLHGIDEY